VFRSRSAFRLLFLIYILIGIFVAFNHNYINERFLKELVSALLAIFLWFLVLLGVNLHIH